MNSIRSFVEHLVSFDSIMELSYEEWSEIGKMDSRLLEEGYIFYKDFPTTLFFKQNGTGKLSWVITFEGRPHLISGFYIDLFLTKVKVVIRLREITIGDKLPFNLSNSKYERILEILHFGSSFKLANCPAKTFEWLKTHEATKKVVERISHPA